MKKAIDIYNYRKRLDSAVKMVKELPISERNYDMHNPFKRSFMAVKWNLPAMVLTE